MEFPPVRPLGRIHCRYEAREEGGARDAEEAAAGASFAKSSPSAAGPWSRRSAAVPTGAGAGRDGFWQAWQIEHRESCSCDPQREDPSEKETIGVDAIVTSSTTVNRRAPALMARI
jgi:hypothetical protein